jgi:Na+/H+-dicarboxylate symporter
VRLSLWMTIGLLAGLAFGLVAAASDSSVLRAIAAGVKPAGTLFLNLLSMVVIPLVMAALFTGVAGLGDVHRLGRLGMKTLGFFWLTTALAIVIGFVLGAVFLPLAPVTSREQGLLGVLTTPDSGPPVAGAVRSAAEFVVDLVPRNPVRAAVDGSLLPLVVFVTACGVATAALPAPKRDYLVGLADAATQVLIRIVYWVLLVAPVGIFALVAGAVAQFGWSLVRAMAVFVATVIAGVVLFIVGVYLPLVATLGHRRPIRFLRASLSSMAMGFSTTSSLATLPTMLQAADDELSLPRSVSGFVLPVAASLNRAGSALFQAVALLFVAGLYGVPIGPAQYVQAGVAVFLASLTVASVPAASVVSLAPAFAQTGVPLAGLSLLIGLDRIPDMFRTMTNVTGHLAAAVTINGIERDGRT